MLARGFVPPLRGWFFFLKRNPRAFPWAIFAASRREADGEWSELISIVPKLVLLRVSRRSEPSECRLQPGIPLSR